MAQEQKIYSEEEINLIDYFNVILKRKRLIFLVFVLAVVGAGVFSYFSPKIYRTETVLEIGHKRGVEEGIIEDPIQIVEKIKLGIYEKLVRVSLGIPEENLEIKAENPEGTRLVKIEVESTNPKLTKMILEEINDLILSNHRELIRVEKELFKNDIEKLRTKIISLKEEKEHLKVQVGTLERVPLQEQTVPFQFTLFSLKERLEVRKQQIEGVYLRINSLERLLESIQPTKVIKAPPIPEAPIKPRPVLNMFIAGILGIFFGTFLAFFREFLEKNKTKCN